MKTTNNEIKVLRTKLGVTQEQFSKIIGSSHNTVARWEQGLTAPSARFLLRLRVVKKNQTRRIGVITRRVDQAVRESRTMT